MFDDLKLSPKDEDEMEDFRDYGDDSDDVESKLDDYEDDEDEDEDDDESSAVPVLARVIVPQMPSVLDPVDIAIIVIEEEIEPEGPPRRKPAQPAKKLSLIHI